MILSFKRRKDSKRLQNVTKNAKKRREHGKKQNDNKKEKRFRCSSLLSLRA